MLWDLARLRCPVCREGTVFKGPYSMRPDCPKCGVHFERENGYFMGAMWIAYFMGSISIIPTIVILVRVVDAEMPVVIGVGAAQLILFQPLIYMYSRMIWMYIDRSGVKKDWH
jgi:uncharacterized protein (DUF983 family)